MSRTHDFQLITQNHFTRPSNVRGVIPVHMGAHVMRTLHGRKNLENGLRASHPQVGRFVMFTILRTRHPESRHMTKNSRLSEMMYHLLAKMSVRPIVALSSQRFWWFQGLNFDRLSGLINETQRRSCHALLRKVRTEKHRSLQ
jgi:hypothetical protein